jgi:hypothetical protein
MRTNHPGSAALSFTASNLTLLRFSPAIVHLCGKRVCVARTRVARRIETAPLSRMPDDGRRHLALAERAARALIASRPGSAKGKLSRFTHLPVLCGRPIMTAR